MAVSKKNKACLPACRRDGSSRPHTPIRKQSSVTKAGQRGRTRHQDPTRQVRDLVRLSLIRSRRLRADQLTWCHCAASMHARIPIALLASDSSFSLRGRGPRRTTSSGGGRRGGAYWMGRARDEEECPVDGPNGIAAPFSSLLLHMS
jgi:hypothetical protein